LSQRILIADSAQALHALLRPYLEAAGFFVMGVHRQEDALTELAEAEADIIFTSAVPGGFDGEKFCIEARKAAPRCATVLIYPPDAATPGEDAARAGVDSYLVAPVKGPNVVACARTVAKLRNCKEKVHRLEEARRQAALTRTEDAPVSFSFFRRFLQMEVKRSQRYRYPVSVALVGLDGFSRRASEMGKEKTTQLLSEMHSLLASKIRGVDLAIPVPHGRTLLFLPHTGSEGAIEVATRAKERLNSALEPEKVVVSLGLAFYEPSASKDSNVSFGKLLLDAASSLKRAQKAGGNRIEGTVKTGGRKRISIL
jgi:diguanylate cyclase (GGDEF)-like protein